jgi:HK97 family phage major capsid protein
MNLEAAARALNAGPEAARDLAEQRAHTQAFENWLRYGDGAEQELAAAAKAGLPRQGGHDGSDPGGGYLVPFERDPTIDRMQPIQGGLARSPTCVEHQGRPLQEAGQPGRRHDRLGRRDRARTSTSTPTLSEIEIVLGEVYANMPASQDLLDDGEDVQAWLNDEVMISFDEAKNTAFVTGDGIKKPRGLMDYTIVANASYAWGSVGYIATGGAADFAASNPDNALQDMISALKQKYRPNARWIGNRGTVGKVRKFKDSTGQPLWQPSLQLGQPATLLGYPVTEDDNFADVGANAYPLAFGDFKKAYTIAEKTGLSVNLRDPYTNKPYVMFYMVMRVGGGVTNFEAFKVLKVATS